MNKRRKFWIVQGIALAILITLVWFASTVAGQDQTISHGEEEIFDIQAASAPINPISATMAAIKNVYMPNMTTHNHRVIAAATLTLPNEIDFGPFNQRLIPVELQAWWSPAYGHIHVAAMLPLGQPVSGTLNVPIRIVLHDNPATLQQLRFDTDKGVSLKVPLGNLKCPDSVCSWGLTVKLDTTKMVKGWRELRIRAETVTPDGKKYLPSSGIPIYVNNPGGSPSNYNRFCDNTSLIGRGWYDPTGYTNAVIECVPLTKVSGMVTFRVRAQEPSQRLIVDLNKSHFIPAVGVWPQQNDAVGVNLFDKTGDYQSWQNIIIDTKILPNGWHSLAVRSVGPKGEVSNCVGCPTEKSFPSGVAKIWFFVEN